MTFLVSCGHSLGTDYAWPGEDGRTICFECFEAQADGSWWEMVAAVVAMSEPSPNARPNLSTEPSPSAALAADRAEVPGG